MVLIIDEQNKQKIETELVKLWAEGFLKKLGLASWDLSVVFVEPETSASYNLAYRKKQGPTDVLSFPFYPDFKFPESLSKLKKSDAKDLGDIIICPEKIVQDCQEFNLQFNERLERLVAHSLTHLLGHDHETPEQVALMHPVEEMLMGRALDDYKED